MLNLTPTHATFKPGDAASFVACYHPDAKQRANGQWLVCCPAHEDKQPSLSIGQGDKGIVLKCFAGCEVKAICDKLGIRETDLFKPRPVNLTDPLAWMNDGSGFSPATLALARSLGYR